MNRLAIIAFAANLTFASMAAGQTPPQVKPPANPVETAGDLAEALARHLGNDLQVKAVVGKPVTAGSVTLIPILMLDLNFAGGGLTAPAAKPGEPQPASQLGDGFLMTGEARPLGFVVITRKSTRFVSATSAPAK